MAILHTVNKSPLTHNALASCLRLACKGEGILLIEDGVFGALINTAFIDELIQSLNDLTVYALQPDLAGRGALNKVHPKIQLIDYVGFVNLTTQYAKVLAWF